MKTKMFLLAAGMTLIYSTHATAQHTKRLDYAIPPDKQDSLLLIKTDYPATGIVIRTESGQSFGDTYLVVEKDTLLFNKDDESVKEEDYQYSNLQTFSMPLSAFLFHPGNLRGDIQFVFIDARMPENAAPQGVSEKKKRCFLWRAFHGRTE